MNFGSIIVAALAAVALTACSANDSNNGTDGGGGRRGHGGSETSTSTSSTEPVSTVTTGGQQGGDGEATLTVTSAELTPSINGSTPSKDGYRFLVLTATIENVSQTPPLLASFELFSLKTVDQLVYSPTGLSDEVDNPCNGEVSVAPGGSITCGVAFEVPPAVAAQELDYVMPKRITLSAGVPTPAASACDTSPSQSGNCVNCLEQRCVGSAMGACQNGGEGSCMQDCWIFSGKDLCTCQVECNADDACVSAFHAISTCATNLCGGAGC